MRDYLPTDDPNHPWNTWVAEREANKKHRSRHSRWLLVMLLLVTTNLVSIAIVSPQSITKLFNVQKTKQGWVNVPYAQLYTSPDTNAVRLTSVSEGSQFTILEMRTNASGWWVHARFYEWLILPRAEGWLRIEDITEEERFNRIQ